MISPTVAATALFVIVLTVITVPWWWPAPRAAPPAVSRPINRTIVAGIVWCVLSALAQPSWAAIAELNQPQSGGEGGARLALPVGGATRAHEINTMPTGTLDGILRLQPVTGAVRVLADYPFTVEVRMGEQVLVRVDKRTDTAGHFSIKNILSHRALAYFVEASLDGLFYRSMPLPLAPNVREQHFDVVLQPAAAGPANVVRPRAAATLPVGPDTPGFMPNPLREVALTMDHAQYLSLGLCGLVGLVLLWQGRRMRRRVRDDEAAASY